MTILVALLLTTRAAAATWPAEADWRPIDGIGLIDPPDDYGGGDAVFDIVGTMATPAGYWYADADNLYLRVRLADTTVQSPPLKWKSFAFVGLIESDGDLTSGTWDVGILLDGAADDVALGTNAIPGGYWCADPMDEPPPAVHYPAPPDETGNARVVEAGTALGGGADVFLDTQVVWADVAAFTGVMDPFDLSFVYATSASAQQLNKDVSGGDCEGSWSDNFVPDSDGDGLSDLEEEVLELDPYDPDSDGDGLSDGDEVRVTDTDPLDADSDDGGVSDGDEWEGGLDPNDAGDDATAPGPVAGEGDDVAGSSGVSANGGDFLGGGWMCSGVGGARAGWIWVAAVLLLRRRSR